MRFGIERFLEHPLIEINPAQLPVDIERGIEK